MKPYFAYSYYIGSSPRDRFHAGDFYFEEDYMIKSAIRDDTIISESFYSNDYNTFPWRCSLVFDYRFLYFTSRNGDKYVRKNLITGEEVDIFRLPQTYHILKFEKYDHFIFAHSKNTILLYDTITMQKAAVQISRCYCAKAIKMRNEYYVCVIDDSENLQVYNSELWQIHSIKTSSSFSGCGSIHICGDIIYCVYKHFTELQVISIDIFHGNKTLPLSFSDVETRGVFTHGDKLYVILRNFETIIVKTANGRIANVRTKLCNHPKNAVVKSASHFVTSAGQLTIAVNSKDGNKHLHFLIVGGKVITVGNRESHFYNDMIFAIDHVVSKQYIANIYFLDSRQYNFAKLYKYINRGDRKKAIAIAAAIRVILLPQIGQSYKYIAAEVCRHFFATKN